MQIVEMWNKFQSIPLGKKIASIAFSYYVPYSGSVRPEILELKPGYCKIKMKERRGISNHLGSVHAAALMNFAEAASGLALNAGIPSSGRSILTAFQISYLKKARGILFAECSCEDPDTREPKEIVVTSIVKNTAGEVVAEAKATWKVGPKK